MIYKDYKNTEHYKAIEKAMEMKRISQYIDVLNYFNYREIGNIIRFTDFMERDILLYGDTYKKDKEIKEYLNNKNIDDFLLDNDFISEVINTGDEKAIEKNIIERIDERLNSGTNKNTDTNTEKDTTTDKRTDTTTYREDTKNNSRVTEDESKDASTKAETEAKSGAITMSSDTPLSLINEQANAYDDTLKMQLVPDAKWQYISGQSGSKSGNQTNTNTGNQETTERTQRTENTNDTDSTTTNKADNNTVADRTANREASGEFKHQENSKGNSTTNRNNDVTRNSKTTSTNKNKTAIAKALKELTDYYDNYNPDKWLLHKLEYNFICIYEEED